MSDRRRAPYGDEVDRLPKEKEQMESSTVGLEQRSLTEGSAGPRWRTPSLIVQAVLGFALVSLLVAFALYGIDPFLIVVAGIVGACAITMWLGRGRWASAAGGFGCFAFGFVMFQLNFAGPSGEDVTETAAHLEGWFGLLGVAAGALGLVASVILFRSHGRKSTN